MSNTTHGYNLRPNVKSRLDKRIKGMVDACGGPNHVIGKPSATGVGVHIIFQQEELPKPHPHHRPSIRTPPKDDVEMVDSSDSKSGSDSDSDVDSSEPSSGSDMNAEPNTPRQERHDGPSLPLWTPKLRRTEDLQPEGWQEASRRKAPSDIEDVEAARRGVAAQHREEAKRIRLEQLQKQARLGAWQLRQQAADLERETAEHTARLLREMEEGVASTAMDEDEDRFDVRSNHSYTPTATSSSDDNEYWSSSPFRTPTFQARDIDERSPTPTLPATPPPSTGPSRLGLHVTTEARRQVQGARPLSRQHAVAIPLASSPTSSPPGAETRTRSFVVVTRKVLDGRNDLTGSPVHRTKKYRVRAADLESLHGDSDMPVEG